MVPVQALMQVEILAGGRTSMLENPEFLRKVRANLEAFDAKFLTEQRVSLCAR